MVIIRALALTVLVLAATGCGYQFSGSGSVLPQDVKTVAILPVENQTTESGVGPEFTEDLHSEFERYGVVKLVDSAHEADATLKTKVKSVDSTVRNTTGATDIGVDQNIVLKIACELRRKTGQVLWRNDDLKVTSAYAGVGGAVVTTSSAFVSGDIASSTLGSLGSREVSRGQMRQALDDMIEEAARQIYQDAVAADF